MQGRGMGLPRAAKRALFVLACVLVARSPAPIVHAGTDDAAAVQALANEERRREALPAVELNRTAARIAARHSDRMRGAGRIFHNDDLGAEADAARLGWAVIGENVGVGASVQSVHDAFMNSASHRHIILDGRYRLLGVGIVRADDDRVYVTQVFVRMHAESGGDLSAAPAAAHCDGPLRAEDGSKVAASYYGDSC